LIVILKFPSLSCSGYKANLPPALWAACSISDISQLRPSQSLGGVPDAKSVNSELMSTSHSRRFHTQAHEQFRIHHPGAHITYEAILPGKKLRPQP
jgi:hypothetical protein